MQENSGIKNISPSLGESQNGRKNNISKTVKRTYQIQSATELGDTSLSAEMVFSFFLDAQK